MPLGDGVTRLRASSDRLREREFFTCTVPELDLLEALGDPLGDTVFDDGPPRLFWDFEFPCGLAVGLQFDQLTQRLTGHLDAAEVEHALRHLDLEPSDLWLLEEALPQRFLAQAARPDRRWAVATAGGHGPARIAARGLVRRDADCLVAELNQGHDGPYQVVEEPGHR